MTMFLDKQLVSIHANQLSAEAAAQRLAQAGKTTAAPNRRWSLRRVFDHSRRVPVGI
jgi:hypothetical protein